MPAEGETKTRFGRQYTFVNPVASQGPGTWRLSTIDEIAATGGGGGGSGITDIDGVVPITSTATGAGEVDIAIDLSGLDSRE